MQQGYHDWYQNTPLGIWTNPNISGPLLDWIANGIYGVSRPFVGTASTVQKSSAINRLPINTAAINSNKIVRSGTSTIVTDAVYKRLLNYLMYLGDGKQLTIPWAKRRMARFIYGVNGTDVPIEMMQQISIVPKTFSVLAGYNSAPYNSQPYNTARFVNNPSLFLNILLPNVAMSQIFIQLLQNGSAPAPIQINYTIGIAS